MKYVANFTLECEVKAFKRHLSSYSRFREIIQVFQWIVLLYMWWYHCNSVAWFHIMRKICWKKRQTIRLSVNSCNFMFN